jgi:threonyl-tRNA synthetase
MQNEQSKEYLHNLRHTTAHLLAASVLELYPDAKLTLGPAIEDGFYYDIDFGETKISEEDLKKIEKKMKKLVNKWIEFSSEEVSTEKAREVFAGNEYKLELIDGIVERGEKITLYTCGGFMDLCRGGHVEEPNKEIGALKLMSVAGAYWRGDEKNPMLTRIYGTAFETKEELNEYTHMLGEAKKRDHRKIGKVQDLFFIDETVGKGLAMWLPNGVIIKDEVQKLAVEKERERGYQRVSTPHIAKEELFLRSGHLPYYKDSMYPPMEMDDGTYYLRAMNCPHHHQMYIHKKWSYRELPVRFAEYGMVYRNELSGALAGLLRVRGLEMNDAHIYCRKDQIKGEFTSVMKLVLEYFDIFEFKEYSFRLSKWDSNHTDKYIDQPENWEYCEQILREVLQEMSVPFVEVENEAAFYGPKVDVQFKSVIGREESLSTIQLDFLAKERFGLSYTDDTGNENNDVFVIHRAPLSVHERFIAFLIEQYAGSWPVWLAPVQVQFVPVSTDKHLDGARDFAKEFVDAGIRAEVDEADETVGNKIRKASKQKIPYIVVVGDTEIGGEGWTIRVRGQEEQERIEKDTFLCRILEEIRDRA